MSATLNAEKLLNYYKWKIYPYPDPIDNATTYEIKSKAAHKVHVFYINELQQSSGEYNYLKFPTDDTMPTVSKECMRACNQLIKTDIPRLDKTKAK